MGFNIIRMLTPPRYLREAIERLLRPGLSDAETLRFVLTRLFPSAPAAAIDLAMVLVQEQLGVKK